MPDANSGFPKVFYEVQFSSPASPELSRLVVQALNDAGLSARGIKRGLDHGLFVPARVVFGETTHLPFVQVSLPRSDDPAQSVALGRALAPLRVQGYLLAQGGMICHNLRDVRKAQSLWVTSTEIGRAHV